MFKAHREQLTAFIFLLPSLIGVTVFCIVPYIICFVKSLFIGTTFVGFRNYADLFGNGAFLLALKNTAVFTFTAIPLLMVISFLIALFLNSFKKISSFFRSSLIIPVVVPVTSLICVWQVIFDDYGAINNFLNSVGLNTVEFFNSGFSMLMIILIYVWKYCGFCVILFTAGLANVNQSLYESARLVTKITIPMITPTTFFVFLMEIIYSFKIFREVFALFGEYPYEDIYFIQNFINNNYYNLNYPRLSSASMILSLFIVLILLVFFIFERKHSFAE